MELCRGTVQYVNLANGTGAVTFDGKKSVVFYLYLCRTLTKIRDHGLAFTNKQMDHKPKKGEIIVAAWHGQTTIGYWTSHKEYRRAGRQPAQLPE